MDSFNKDIFLKEEGDNFFKRNQQHFNASNDIVIKNLMKEDLKNKKILELGCSNAWRLNELQKMEPLGLYYGVDPSKLAIEDGTKNTEHINLTVGTADELGVYENNFFDIILIPFVFMYIDRSLLFKSISEIDRVLNNNGKLIITDFYSNRQRKNVYKHTENTFIYKQNYYEIFVNSKNYFLCNLNSFFHNTANNNCDIYDETCFYAELVKDTVNMFN